MLNDFAMSSINQIYQWIDNTPLAIAQLVERRTVVGNSISDILRSVVQIRLTGKFCPLKAGSVLAVLCIFVVYSAMECCTGFLHMLIEIVLNLMACCID